MIDTLAVLATAHDVAAGIGYYLLASIPATLFALALLRGGNEA